MLGNSKERFRSAYVMHLELLGSLWLLRIMRAESSEFTANYAVVRMPRKKGFLGLTPQLRLIDASRLVLPLTRHLDQTTTTSKMYDNSSQACATVSSCVKLQHGAWTSHGDVCTCNVDLSPSQTGATST